MDHFDFSFVIWNQNEISWKATRELNAIPKQLARGARLLRKAAADNVCMGGYILDQNGISWNHKSGSTVSMHSLVLQQVF